ncbi:MAG: TonB-dependent receptor [Bacteroidia bacterium]
MRFNLLLVFIYLLLGHSVAFAQSVTISGTVKDANNLMPVKSVSVKSGRQNTSVTDSLGRFSLTLPQGRHTLVFTCIGYKQLMRTVNTTTNITLDVEITPAVNQLNQVVVSASRHEKKLAQEVVSMNIIKPEFIVNTNSVDLAAVVNRVPGVNVVDGQATIRGGVGYSYNTGSRVMVLLDDMPLMGPEAGDLQWKFLPIEAAEQIEVVKGTNSVLYGSSALNGSINVRTGWPGKTPETKLSTFHTIFQNPKRKEMIWWKTGSQPNQTGTFFTHKQQFGNFDLVWTGNVFSYDNFLQQNDEHRIRTYVKTRYRSKKIEGLSYGLNANVLYEKAGRFYLWENADSGAYKPFSGNEEQFPMRIFSIDPHFTYEKKNGTRHLLKMRHYDITRFADKIRFPLGRGAKANLFSVDYSYKTKLTKNLISTSGIYVTSLVARSNNYPGKFKGYSGAVYTQLDYMYKRWSAVAGMRYELNAIGGVSYTPRPLIRGGLNYRAAKQTFLRLSYGEGYRFPTVAERYVQDLAADLKIVPNPSLQSERGWTGEVGVQQGFKVDQFSGSVDYAVYWMEYTNLIEYNFGQHEPPTLENPLGVIGFKPKNIGRARVAGMELSVTGEGRIGQVFVRTLCGATLSYPVNLNKDTAARKAGNYIGDFFDNTGSIDSINLQNILPYRNRKLLKADMEVEYKRFSVGYSAFYYGAYENIDFYLLLLVPGLNNFMKKTGSGDWVHNMRFAWKASDKLTAAFLVNNVANHEYALRPAKMDAPRSFTLQMRYLFR